MNLNTVYYADDEECEQSIAAVQSSRPQCIEVRLPSFFASDTIELTLNALAETALSLWPRWYDGTGLPGAKLRSVDERLDTALAIIELCRDNTSIEMPWLKKAAHLAAQNRRPRTPRLVAEIEAGQLALALGGHAAGLILVLSPNASGKVPCDGFPRAAEWLARECGLPVYIMLPAAMKTCEGLAPLLHNARTYREMATPPPGDGDSDASMPERTTDSGRGIPSVDEDPLSFERLIGKPHHNSPGEQLLAKRLADDPRLSGLFGHNISVRTRCGRIFIVDLLWREGMLVVEIDGYGHLWDTAKFADDRDRDYRLFISGYRVLRLTHDEVRSDPDLALEKIHDVVMFIRSQESEKDDD